GHRRTEDQPVEVVADVVVVCDRRGVALGVVATAAQARLLLRWRRWRAEGAELGDGAQRSPPAAGAEAQVDLLPRRLVAEPVAQREQVVDVALQVEVPGDVRAAQPELVGGPYQPAQRVG